MKRPHFARATSSTRRRSGGESTFMLDPLLVPRIQQYSQNSDARNVDSVITYLTRNYREYQRKQQGPFRKQVMRAIQIALKNQEEEEGSESEDDDLAAQEDAHMRRRYRDGDVGDTATSSSDSERSTKRQKSSGRNEDDHENDPDNEVIEGLIDPETLVTPNLLNSSLRLTYEGRPSLRIEPSLSASAAKKLGDGKGDASPSVSASHGRLPASPALKVTVEPNPASLTPSVVAKAKKLTRTTGATGQNKTDITEPSSVISAPRQIWFKDFGGIESTLGTIRELIEYPLAHPEVYAWLGVEPPRGVLLHGPPGCGKTMLAHAIARETGVPFLKISAPEVVSGMSGESEAKIRSLFADAVRVAPCIVFIDEIDAITPKRETAQREMERRIVAQLLTCMDDLNQPTSSQTAAEGSTEGQVARTGHVVVIGATNRPDALDPALRRAGRFDREIALGIPDEQARAQILQVLSHRLRLEGTFDFKSIARRTPGFVGADLQALTKEAAAIAVKRIFSCYHPSSASSPPQSPASCHPPADNTPETRKISWQDKWGPSELRDLSITMSDFEAAISKVQPSAKREGFATIPDVSWDDVGALGEVREELQFSISLPIKSPEQFQAMGLEMSIGILLYGPPGCGKTLLAKAIAADAGANFISIKGPELLNKFVGESERAVRQLFSRARASSPCVLFFDEMDAMAPRRGSDGNQAAERVVNQLLTEMDGLDSRKSIFIIAATNRPDMIDAALLRPGRLDKLLYVPLPTALDRAAIIKTLLRKVPLAPTVEPTNIAESDRCQGFSGADMAALVREACVEALRERRAGSGSLEGPPLVETVHFDRALLKIQPSVSEQDMRKYESLRQQLRRSRGHIGQGS